MMTCLHVYLSNGAMVQSQYERGEAGCILRMQKEFYLLKME